MARLALRVRACWSALALHTALGAAFLFAPLDRWLLWVAWHVSSLAVALVGTICFVRSLGSTGGVVWGAVAVGIAVITWLFLGLGPLPYAD